MELSGVKKMYLMDRGPQKDTAHLHIPLVYSV